MTYDLAAGQESVLLSPEKGHHGDEHREHDGKNNVSHESERAARVHRGWRADGTDAAAGGEEADGDEDAETHDDADFVGSGVGAVVVEEALRYWMSFLFIWWWKGLMGGCRDLHDADVAECCYDERDDADVEEDDGCDVESDAGLLFEGDDDRATGETHYSKQNKLDFVAVL